METHIDIDIHTYVYIYTCTIMYLCIYAIICTGRCVCMIILVFTCRCICICICYMYVYIYIYVCRFGASGFWHVGASQFKAPALVMFLDLHSWRVKGLLCMDAGSSGLPKGVTESWLYYA